MEQLAEKIISECVKIEKDIWNREAWYEKEIAACEASVAQAHGTIGDTPIVIDYLMHPRPLGLAKYLLEHGILCGSCLSGWCKPGGRTGILLA